MSSAENKSGYQLIEFTQGTSIFRYTNWTDNLQGYTAAPEIELELEALNGTLEEESCSITLPADDFTAKLTQPGLPVPVSVKVLDLQIGVSGIAQSGSALFGGVVATAVENPDGIRSLVRLECESNKSRLDTALGIEVGPTCWKRFLGTACGLDEANFQYSCVVSSIDADNYIITVSGLPTRSDISDNWFSRGWLKFDGVQVGCRFWSKDAPGLVYVREIPPLSWLGQTVTFTSGCLRRQVDCDDRGNSENFGGIGKKIPAYSPHFETGT